MKNSTRPCDVAACTNDALSQWRGTGRYYCRAHYEALRRNPDATRLGYIPKNDRERLMVKVRKINGHWMWIGSTDGGGRYGGFYYQGKVRRAHRVSWEMAHGPIPEGMVLDHKCRKTLCVNPDHLQVVTQRENILIGDAPTARNAAKTHCIRGHAFTAENIIFNRDGGRQCKACRELRNARRRAANAARKKSA